VFSILVSHFGLPFDFPHHFLFNLRSLFAKNNPMMKPTTELLLLSLLFSLLFLSSLFLFSPSIIPSGDLSFLLKPPFRPIDLLPFLPHAISFPILKSLNSAIDLLPSFVGSVASSENRIQWKGACFYENEAWLEFHNESESKYGGGRLHIKVIFLIPSIIYDYV
jgi:hypothetical protein